MPLFEAVGQTPDVSTPPSTATVDPTTVTLDPFEVQTTTDKSYGELNSNSITAFKTELDKMPVSADVFDQTLMGDTGSVSVEQMIQYFSAGAGSASSQPDTSAANSQYLDRNANGSLSLRGLQAPTVMLNGFFPAGGGGIAGTGITSPFDLEKIEIVNGPQAILYGVGGAGGVINETLKLARLGSPAFGSLGFLVDQYGHKQGTLDYGAGTNVVAVRVALIDQDIGDRRVFYGGPMSGQYVQVAVKPFKNTTIRVSFDDQTFNRIDDNGGGLALTAASTSNDARNGQTLHWLLATNQLNAAANGGASGAGAIPGINWNTVDSLQGDLSGEYHHRENELMSIDTVWTSWLSSQVSLGYTGITNFKVGNSQITYDAPNVTANPTGTFASVYQSSAEASLWEPTRQKVGRVAFLANNQLFGGAVHSQTVLGVDATRTDTGTISEYYVAADSNFNPVLSTVATANGYQILPTQYWSDSNGPIQYPLGINPNNPRVVINGQNYVRAVTNATNPALISASNPEGLTGSGIGDFRHTSDIENGQYFANYSDFFGGNLTTLGGVRWAKVYDRSDVEASAPNPPSILSQTNTKFTAYDGGLNFKIISGLRGYAQYSTSFNPAGVGTVDPDGKSLKPAHGTGEEAGLKYTLPQWNLSGQLAIYHASSQNETLSFTSTIARDINPTGLNGIYNAGTNSINVNRETQGAQLTVTAAPGNWRFRLSASTIKSTIESTVSYAQLYNDQFHQDSAGDVTYADGTIVYVPPTYNSKVLTEPSTTAGAIPLTLALMNNPSSSYYANPAPVSAAIGTAAVGNVLKVVDPVHGPILTGALGLPISMLQIAPNPTAPPPGVLTVAQSGDAVSGFPRYAANFIGIYTVPTGYLKGFRFGGSASIAWETSMYYYYSAGVSNVTTSPRIMLYEPTETVINGILGYEHKFRRVTFSTQLNINNMFNHYHVLYLPSSFNGWSGVDNATLDQPPRVYVWSTELSF